MTLRRYFFYRDAPRCLRSSLWEGSSFLFIYNIERKDLCRKGVVDEPP